MVQCLFSISRQGATKILIHMAKVITFSRVFPAYHPKAGQPTHFVEKIYKAFDVEMPTNRVYPKCDVLGVGVRELNKHELYYQTCDFINSLSKYGLFKPKIHTIRAGERWKDGEMASLRVWSAKAYNSPQLIIAPDVEVRVQKIELNALRWMYVDGKRFDDIDLLAMNDGLTREELAQWFQKPFVGQIIHFSGDFRY